MISTEQRTYTKSHGTPAKAEQTIGIKPRRADLVESVNNGQLYLRAYEGGHFYWQPVSDREEAIPDKEAWRTGLAYYQQYWLNHGAFRRRSGRYFPIAEPGNTTRAA